MSGRATLTENLTDVLVQRGDLEVSRSLAQNAGARFSETGFTTLAKRAEADDRLAERLGLRLDLPIRLLRELLLRASEVVRTRALAMDSPETRDQIQTELSKILTQVGIEASMPRDFRSSDNLVKELNREGKLKEPILLGFAADGRYEEMTSCLALFCQVSAELIESLMKNASNEGILVACRAAGLSWTTAGAVLKARFSHHTISTRELAEAQAAFLALSQAAAQITMRFMAVKTTVKKAG
jgi:uncharacterized protein (DUF2336 family)